MHAKPAHSASSSNCKRTRVAENAVATIDLCDCGMFHVHVGAMTLRMEPGAAKELLAALRTAIGHTASEASMVDDAIVRAMRGSGRGQA